MLVKKPLGALGQQIPQRQVVYYVLDVLDPVLEPVTLASQDIVLEIENLKAGKHILDKLVDQQRPLVVAESDGIARKAGLYHRMK